MLPLAISGLLLAAAGRVDDPDVLKAAWMGTVLSVAVLERELSAFYRTSIAVIAVTVELFSAS